MNRDIMVVEHKKVIFDVEAIIKTLPPRTVSKSRDILGILGKLVKEARSLARPRAGAIISSLTLLEGNQVEVDGVLLTSSLLKDKLSEVRRVFPYLATEGLEMAQWGASRSDEETVLTNALRLEAVRQTKGLLEDTILKKYGIPQISAMNPGSLLAWPLTQQEFLFQILEPLPQELGITLLPSFMMNPDYSVSGIFFQSDIKFFNCQLCPREDCSERKAPKTVS